MRIIDSSPDRYYENYVRNIGDINKDGFNDIFIGSLNLDLTPIDTAFIMFGSEHPRSIIDFATSTDVLTLENVLYYDFHLTEQKT